MNTLRTLKKLVLGETWLLPLGLVGVVAVSVLLRTALGGAWSAAGGLVLPAGVIGVLVLSVSTSARPR